MELSLYSNLVQISLKQGDAGAEGSCKEVKGTRAGWSVFWVVRLEAGVG